MRLPSSVLYAARAPQQENAVPFKEILPLKLKNSVSGKSGSLSDVSCLQEMAVMFACLKENEFSENFCSKEISTFQKCYKFHLDKKFKSKETVSQGIIAPGRNLNYKQLNKYLRRFPNPF